MRIWFTPVLLAAFSVCAATAHSPLLPQPQHIDYQSGTIPIAGLSIRIAGNPAPEDLFAASELQRILIERSGIHLVLERNGDAHRAIVLMRTGPVDALLMPGDQPGPQSKEAYRLEISSSGVVIRSRSSAGVFYGIQTLAQLVESANGTAVLHEVRIDDWPSLPVRGTMVDMSEGPLATEAEVKRQIDQLARWKANQYYFYSEDSIELDGYPLLNPGARFSKQQIRGIIAYARERHIDVIPCLELYGHQHDLFRIEKYAGLADFPHGGEFDPANPKIQAVLNDWIDQYSDLFPSRFVHIGFDETWEIARAASKQGAGATPGKLFIRQLNQVAHRFQDHGRTVMAWADIMVKFPDIISQLPAGLIAVPWFYEPDQDPQYRAWLDPLARQGVSTIVAPGVNMWSEIFPDFDKSFRNIDTFLAAGRRNHALGIVNTFWTDDQQALRRMSWPGLAYGAAAAWQTVPMDARTFFQDYAAIVYPPAVAPHVAAAFGNLSQAELALQKVWGPATMDAMWRDPFAPSEWNRLNSHREDLHQARLLAESGQEDLDAAVGAGGDATSLNAPIFGARLLDYAAMRGLYALEIGDLWNQQRERSGRDRELWSLISSAFSQTHGRIGDIMDALSLLDPLYRENWLAEYTPYRLKTALLHWNMEYEYWGRLQRNYGSFRGEYKDGTPVPPLDTLR